MTLRPGESSTSRGARRRFTVDDLFQDTSPRGEGVVDLEAAKVIRLDRIVPDPEQPRRTMDPGRFDELVASVRQEGILVPIEVSYDAERNIYVIVHGERRYRAAREAGLTTIPALVREVDSRQRIVHQLMENILREDLNAVDRARALRTLKEAMGGAAWESVADAVGIRRSRVFQLLDVIKLPEELQEDIRAGRISEKHGRAFKDLGTPQQAELRDLVIAERLSGDETLRVAQTLRRGPAEMTVREAFTVTRKPPEPLGTGNRDQGSQPQPATAIGPDRPALQGGDQGGPGLQDGDRSGTNAQVSAGEPLSPALLSEDMASSAGPVAAIQIGEAAVPLITGFDDPTLSLGASALVAYERAHHIVMQLLPELAAGPLDDEDRQRAVALLEDLQDLVDTTLDQLLRRT